MGFYFFFYCRLVFQLPPPQKKKIKKILKKISLEQSLCSCTGSGLALQILALKGQTYSLDPHALQLFLQHFLQDGAKPLEEIWIPPQGFQQPPLPAQGSFFPVWSKGGCWYQCSSALGGGWWDPSPLWRRVSHQSHSKQLVALSRLHPSMKGRLPPLI